MRNEVIELYLDDIIPNRFQPREKFDESALQELSTSIKEHGVIQPIIVRKIGDKYEIIAGERRYKASALAGLTKIPAIIRNLDDKEASKVALLENLQRENLSAIEEARTYQKILELDSMTQEELGRTMGKSQAAIANKIRLLSLTDEVQEALLNDQISERHARSLLNITNGNEQIEMLNRVIKERMTVRELDNVIKELKNIDIKQQIYSDDNKSEEESKIISQTTIEKDANEQQPVNIDMINPTIETTSTSQPINNQNDFMDEIPIENLNMDDDKITIPTTQSETELFPKLGDTKPIEEEHKAFIEPFKYQDAVSMVKNVIPELKNKGINANIQEFDLENKYQIIINIDK